MQRQCRLTPLIDATAISWYAWLMGNDIQQRIRSVVGSQGRWARATGMTAEQISRVMTGKHPVPKWWEPMLDLLEAIPPKDWPERWKR